MSILELQNIEKIYGEKDNEKINIKFSKTITQSERQVILNIWYNIIKK